MRIGIAIVLAGLPAITLAQTVSPAASDVETLKVQGNVYLITGAGGNIAVQVGDQGVLVVDTGLAAMSDRVVAAIRKLTDKPIQYVINTHVHADHTGGNDAVRKAGLTYCLLYTSPSPRDRQKSRMPSSA